MRTYLKVKREQRRLHQLGKELGADYIEDDMVVFKMGRVMGTCEVAVALQEKGLIIGQINPACDNFEPLTENSIFYSEEALWLSKICKKLAPHVENYKE